MYPFPMICNDFSLSTNSFHYNMNMNVTDANVCFDLNNQCNFNFRTKFVHFTHAVIL